MGHHAAMWGMIWALGGARAGATEPTTRIVAVGDLHGDLDAALATLRLAGVVDASGRWSGGTATLVQTGDTTDRGPDSKGVMDLLRRLQTEATASGGTVVPLLGNHEVMNLGGDWRYVSHPDLLSFGGEAARRAALAVDGEYGRWLRGLDTVARIGDAVFVHGGITPQWAASGVEAINDAVAAALVGGPAGVLGVDGPLWYRGYVQDDEASACAALSEALTALGAARMVVGHTTRHDGRIATRCDGRLHVIDVGISAAYGGHHAAWESSDGDARAVYPDGAVDLPDPR